MKMIMVSLTLLGVMFLFGSTASAKEQVDDSRVQVSFAVKGGISLGSYEAGLNWVLIEEIRRRDYELNTFTGASAGGINTIVSAIRACQQDKLNSVSENIFRTTWDVSIEELMPVNGDDNFDFSDVIDNLDDYLKDDAKHVKGIDKGGIFARKGLLKSIKIVYDEISGDIKYKENCQVNIGLAVTKLFPDVKTVEGFNLKNQRFIIPLQVFTRNNKLYFRNLNPDKKDFVSLDSYLYLPEQIDKTIAPQDVMKVALASSAFPMAFAPVNLHYCEAEIAAIPARRQNCPMNYAKKHDLFSDGGSFDNAPIGSTFTLTEYDMKLKNKSMKDEQVVYGYINPGNLRERQDGSDRKNTSNIQGEPNKYIAGMADYIGLGFHVLDYGMNAELSKAIQRYKEKRENNEKIDFYTTSRFYPLVGDHLAHFAAFFDTAFRRFDFNVGVYDGIINLARYQCESDLKNPDLDFNMQKNIACVGEQTAQLYEHLRIEKGDGKDIFAALVKREFGPFIKLKEWQWLDVDKTLKAYKNSQNISIFLALDGSGCSITSDCSNEVSAAPFKAFLAALNSKHDYQDFTRNMLEDPDEWQYPVLNSTVDRLYEIEQMKYDYLKKNNQQKQADNQEIFLKSLKAAALVTQTVALKKEQGYWPESTVERAKWMELVPDEVGGDVRNGGLYIGYNLWEMQLGTDSPMVLETGFIPYHDLNDDIYNSANTSLDFTLRYHKNSPAWSSTGLGVVAYYDWDKLPGVESRDSYGMSLDVGLLGDKLRVSFLYRNMPEINDKQYSLLIGLADFKGISRWLAD